MGDGFGRLMAEYVVGNILSRELSIVKFSQQQQNNMWDKRYAPPPQKKKISSVTIYNKQIELQ